MEPAREIKATIEALLIASDRPLTIAALARCLDVPEDQADAALRAFEADLQAVDRGIQLQRTPRGLRIEPKPQFAEQLARLQPARQSKPISSQALETLAIVALKQPVTTADINAIRGIESAATLRTLRGRKLIARTARLAPHRERFWRTTPLFLETFALESLDELYKEGRMEQVFASVYSAEAGNGEAEAHLD